MTPNNLPLQVIHHSTRCSLYIFYYDFHFLAFFYLYVYQKTYITLYWLLTERQERPKNRWAWPSLFHAGFEILADLLEAIQRRGWECPRLRNLVSPPSNWRSWFRWEVESAIVAQTLFDSIDARSHPGAGQRRGCQWGQKGLLTLRLLQKEEKIRWNGLNIYSVWHGVINFKDFSRSNPDIVVLYWYIAGHPGYVVNLCQTRDKFFKSYLLRLWQKLSRLWQKGRGNLIQSGFFGRGKSKMKARFEPVTSGFASHCLAH